MIGIAAFVIARKQGKRAFIPAIATAGGIAVAATGLYMTSHLSGIEMPILDALSPYLDSFPEYERYMASLVTLSAGILAGSVRSKYVTTQE